MSLFLADSFRNIGELTTFAARMKARFIILTMLGWLTIWQPLTAQKIEVERLPDLNIPRAGHAMFCANGELVVAGGHTNGFVPTPTAEYFKDGEWHVMQMVYNHDFGYSVVLNNGKVLLGGGCDQPIGIGQTFLAELYDPITHTFDGFGSMEQKRTGASGLELDSGRVVVAGNWYHKDGIEVFDGSSHFTYVKDVAIGRTVPHIFRIAADDALILGRNNTRGDTITTMVAECLKGDSILIPLLAEWQPLPSGSHRDAECFIGDASKGRYTYLMPVVNDSNQVAIMKIDNGVFSLLPTDGPVPMQSQWEGIVYGSSIIVDRQAGRGYLHGLSANYQKEPTLPHRHYVLAIDYAHATEGKGAPMTLYYTDSLRVYPDHTLVLTDEGNLLLAGGLLAGGKGNFTPAAEAYLFHFGTPMVAEAAGNKWWWWLAAVLLLACAFLIVLFRRKGKGQPVVTEKTQAETSEGETAEGNSILMTRINQVMEEQKLYRREDLKLQDVANALSTNRRFVSDCINSQMGCNFIQYVNTYRVNHAKRVLRQNPDKKITDIYIESGFANETSFFRTFKSITGMTPKEWLNTVND